MVGSSSLHLRAPAARCQALGSKIPVFPLETGISLNPPPTKPPFGSKNGEPNQTDADEFP
jgi:hypothetical protein